MKNMKPYVVEMKLPDASWCPVPGYAFDTLDEAVEVWRSIPDDDKARHRVSMLVYRYEPVPEGLL